MYLPVLAVPGQGCRYSGMPRWLGAARPLSRGGWSVGDRGSGQGSVPSCGFWGCDLAGRLAPADAGQRVQALDRPGVGVDGVGIVAGEPGTDADPRDSSRGQGVSGVSEYCGWGCLSRGGAWTGDSMTRRRAGSSAGRRRGGIGWRVLGGACIERHSSVCGLSVEALHDRGFKSLLEHLIETDHFMALLASFSGLVPSARSSTINGGVARRRRPTAGP